MLDQYDVFYDEVNGCYQIRNRSDIFVIEFEDPKRKKLFERIVDIVKEDNEISLKEVINKCKSKYDKADVLSMLQELKEVSLLPYSLKFGLLSEEEASDPRNSNSVQCSDRRIAVIGNSGLTRELATQANRYGFSNCEIESFTSNFSKESLVAFLEDKDFLLFDHSKWNPYLVDQVNKICLELNKPWMHVRGLTGIEGNVGPIFWGKEFGCYDCLSARQKSHDDFQVYNKIYEKHLYENRLESVEDNLPGMDLVRSMLAGLAVMEMAKFLEEWDVPEVLGAYLSMSFLDYSVEKHHLLKNPFCETCKPELSYNISPWLEEVTLS